MTNGEYWRIEVPAGIAKKAINYSTNYSNIMLNDICGYAIMKTIQTDHV